MSSFCANLQILIGLDATSLTLRNTFVLYFALKLIFIINIYILKDIIHRIISLFVLSSCGQVTLIIDLMKLVRIIAGASIMGPLTIFAEHALSIHLKVRKYGWADILL